MRAWQQVLLIGTTLALSWLLMMGLHECGHVLHAWLSGGTVTKVVLHPLSISRTDVQPNPHPLFVAWGGVIWGCLLPCGLWATAHQAFRSAAFWFRFLTGFCCVANGAYLLVGALTRIGDAHDLLRLGCPLTVLILAGLLMVSCGLFCWHGLGRYFGWGESPQPPHVRWVWALSIWLLLMLVLLFWLSPRQ